MEEAAQAAASLNYGRKVISPLGDEAILGTLPPDAATASDSIWLDWARQGGLLRAVDAWITADASTDDRIPRPLPLIAAVGQTVDSLTSPSRANLCAGILAALDDLDLAMVQTIGEEPALKYTDRHEDWYGYVPDVEHNIEEFNQAGGRDGIAETLAHYAWTKKAEALRRCWRWSLIAVGRVLEDPAAAVQRSGASVQRQRELDDALAVYPKQLKWSDCVGLDCLAAYLGCTDDTAATSLRNKVVNEVLRLTYDHPEARSLLDKIIAFKSRPISADTYAPLELVATKNNKARAKTHEMVRDVGSLFSKSREEKRAYRSKWDQSVTKTILVSHTPFPEEDGNHP